MITKWDKFFDEKAREIAREKRVLDAGGGAGFQKSLAPYKEIFKNSDYFNLDINSKLNPKILGDIHNIPAEDCCFDACLCISVLEHCYNPQKAISEIYRVLKPGGKALFYIPFLAPYHGSGYKDYFRFTKDGIEYLFKDFKNLEICPVKMFFEMWYSLLPNPFSRILSKFPGRLLDKIYKSKGNQVMGYYVFVVK